MPIVKKKNQNKKYKDVIKHLQSYHLETITIINILCPSFQTIF